MIILGLGSNLPSLFGDRFNNIDKAIFYMKQNGIKVVKKSSYYETLAFPNERDPKFINIIIVVKSNLSLLKLTSIFLSIENSLGRKRDKKNGPRTCDIDIIDYYGKVINFKSTNQSYTLPHISLIYRNFVLFPLKEILPEWKHPKSKDHINTLISRLSDKDKKSILKVKKP